MGLIKSRYEAQKTNAKYRKMALPTYTKTEFIDWVLHQINFETLYINWVNSNYEKNLTPSIDRINDYQSYTLNNIQLTTWFNNKNKSYVDCKKGINNKRNKQVMQLTKENKKVAIYHSINEAERKTKINQANISSVCLKKRSYAGGFKWKFI